MRGIICSKSNFQIKKKNEQVFLSNNFTVSKIPFSRQIWIKCFCENIAFIQKITVISEEFGTFLYDTGYIHVYHNLFVCVYVCCIKNITTAFECTSRIN